MRARWTATVAVGAALTAGVALAESSGPSLHDYASFGIDRNDGQLVLYSFDEQNQAAHLSVGVLKIAGQALTGIEGSTHVPGHTGMFYAFWTDDDGQTHLLHVAPSEADADQLVSSVRSIEGGKVTGAASFLTNDGQSTRTFVLQRESFIPTYDIDGRIHINPGTGNTRFEFRRVSEEGEVLVEVNRANLNNREWREEHGELDDDGNMVYFDDVIGEGDAYNYEALATLVAVRPMGGHPQDEIEIVSDTGHSINLHNSNTYNFTGKLRVRLYNDHVNDQGMANGKWWIELQGQAQFEQSAVGTVNRIAELKANQPEAEIIEAAVLDHTVLSPFGIAPENLAGLGGRLNEAGEIELFVAEGHHVYRIKPVETDTGFNADTPIVEHALTLNADRDIWALDFAGDQLVGLDGSSSGRFVVLDLDAEGDDNPVLLSTNKPGPHVLGTITFLPVDTAEAMLWPNYD